tara:strand:+ start:952 stop:1440 length:489 start_codon:yes stop_codon:yes gene_type:complete
MNFGLAAFAELPMAADEGRVQSQLNLIKQSALKTLTGLSTTGSNIFASRVHNLSSINLPALLLYTVEEESQPLVMNPARSIEKTLTLHLEGYVKQNATYDDKVDDISKEVEEALFTNRLLDGLVKDSFLTNTEIEYESEGDNPLARVVMDFQVVYHHTEGSI